MKYGLFLYLLFFMTIPAFCQSPVDTAQQIVKGEKNSPEQQKKPYVILISADGFRYDYAQKYGNIPQPLRHDHRAGALAQWFGQQ
jgi:predicted AlkP superfamily pyrophosphatase or phosphodiesterase